ncbi:dihydroorotate dehydrogenase [Pontibacillus marinus]|uniref:Uncharacterized protein n=1 Tax=Pontibacillus marinus BH030004 = DSM 16465 TaxID=1385511 RepID=A0A0A5FZK7_9BACI|nr:hypothetical protein [Pontibacillus marinus]KGX85229.1 hypothetical protein N783_14995 [Pontibacillus marinus BH030004 = DSM 16465]
MPDWSYHPLFKPWLFSLNAHHSREFIYKSMRTISNIPGGSSLIEFLGHFSTPNDLHQNTNGVSYKSPIGVSGMLDPNLTGLEVFGSLGHSFIEIGPVTLREEEGNVPQLNDKDRLWFHKQYEMPHLTYVEKKLRKIALHKPVMLHIDPKATQSQVVQIVESLKPYVSSFIVKQEQLEWIESCNQDTPIYVSIESTEKDTIMNFNHPYVSGVVINPPINWDGEENYFKEDQKVSNDFMCKRITSVKDIDQDLTIITRGGIREPHDALHLKNAGADLMILESGYVFTGPGLPKRINELMTQMPEEDEGTGWKWGLLFGAIILIAGIIALIFSMTRVILPYDEQFIGLTREEIIAINPRILAFMAHDRMTLAGTMISGGIIYIQLARYGLRYRIHWATKAFHTAAILGFLGIFLFIGYGYFDWLHGLYYLFLLPFYLMCFWKTRGHLHTVSSSNKKNSSSWKKSLIGQLLFVILGTSIVVGGIVISTIGTTGVFVSTDLVYLCTTPEMLQSINDRLIPVIAHDRAGFGTALISVGLLVLMTTLWGFREGEKWIWNTLAIGAPPAFIAGLGTHFVIGYTSFIHLLPAYFLVVLYIIGLVYAKPFLNDGAN